MLTATSFASKPGSVGVAAVVHVFCWLAQFYGHGVHEGRAPALLDNLLGGMFFPGDDAEVELNFIFWKALVLAPLFVYYEVWFMLGFLKQTKKDLHNDVGKLTTELRLKKKEAKKE